jgi:hypothetical protein
MARPRRISNTITPNTHAILISAHIPTTAWGLNPLNHSTTMHDSTTDTRNGDCSAPAPARNV